MFLALYRAVAVLGSPPFNMFAVDEFYLDLVGNYRLSTQHYQTIFYLSALSLIEIVLNNLAEFKEFQSFALHSNIAKEQQSNPQLIQFISLS